MNLKQLIVNVVPKKNFSILDIQAAIGKFIGLTMSLDEELKIVHENKNKKPQKFCYSSLNSYKENYQAGIPQNFYIRSADINFLEKMLVLFSKVKSESFHFSNGKILEFHNKSNTIINQTGTCLKGSDGKKYVGAINDENMEEVSKKLKIALIKSYKEMNNISEFIDHDPIESFKVKNKKIMYAEYDKGKVLMNKFIITFKEDKLSQEIKENAVQYGIGMKKTVVGAGFFNFVKEES